MSEILIAIAILGGYFIVYLILKRRLARALQPSAMLREIRGEVDRIIVELNRTTDRNVSLVEDRIRRVSELLEQADRKIGLLRRETEKHELAARVYSELKRREPPAHATEAARAPAPPEGRGEARARVVALSQQGISTSMIARELGMPLGEIELILSLAGQSRGS